MKLRILNNSIRYRLSVTDLRDLFEKGSIIEKLFITIENQFSYGIVKDEHEREVQAVFNKNQILISIPASQIKHLLETDEVGIYESIEMTEDDILKITIEKDFKCLTQRSEDESDLFPNPKEHH